MPDACERMYGLDPTDPFDADKDPDQDGLENVFECTYKRGFCTNWLNPKSQDHDNDGFTDKWICIFAGYIYYDCDDSNAMINPDTPEICNNGFDDNKGHTHTDDAEGIP